MMDTNTNTEITQTESNSISPFANTEERTVLARRLRVGELMREFPHYTYTQIHELMVSQGWEVSASTVRLDTQKAPKIWREVYGFSDVEGSRTKHLEELEDFKTRAWELGIKGKDKGYASLWLKAMDMVIELLGTKQPVELEIDLKLILEWQKQVKLFGQNPTDVLTDQIAVLKQKNIIDMKNDE